MTTRPVLQPGSEAGIRSGGTPPGPTESPFSTGARADSPPVDLVEFVGREGRIGYLISAFGHLLEGRVLDVGCAERHLERLRPDLDYLGIDVGGNPDLEINLDATERLPFDDRSFDAAICCDVLEHLDRLHRTFGELVRVSKKRLIISLPNCWSSARLRLARGRGEIGHYGLPAENPPDRHRWFFSLTQARGFAEAMAERHGLVIREMRVSEKPRRRWIRAIRRLRYPNHDAYLNNFAHTLWIVFERKA